MLISSLQARMSAICRSPLPLEVLPSIIWKSACLGIIMARLEPLSLSIFLISSFVRLS